MGFEWIGYLVPLLFAFFLILLTVTVVFTLIGLMSKKTPTIDGVSQGTTSTTESIANTPAKLSPADYLEFAWFFRDLYSGDDKATIKSVNTIMSSVIILIIGLLMRLAYVKMFRAAYRREWIPFVALHNYLTHKTWRASFSLSFRSKSGEKHDALVRLREIVDSIYVRLDRGIEGREGDKEDLKSVRDKMTDIFKYFEDEGTVKEINDAIEIAKVKADRIIGDEGALRGVVDGIVHPFRKRLQPVHLEALVEATDTKERRERMNFIGTSFEYLN